MILLTVFIALLIIALAIAAVVGIYLFNKYQKKKVEDNKQQKLLDMDIDNQMSPIPDNNPSPFNDGQNQGLRLTVPMQQDYISG
ncbi:MAG: hypothetical protein EZS28_028382, partial [Streblomastix strix]